MIFKQQLIKDLNDLQRELDGEDHEILNCVSEGGCSKAYLGDLKKEYPYLFNNGINKSDVEVPQETRKSRVTAQGFFNFEILWQNVYFFFFLTIQNKAQGPEFSIY